MVNNDLNGKIIGKEGGAENFVGVLIDRFQVNANRACADSLLHRLWA